MEQPSATKWNILGTNDAGFNDGTAFAWKNYRVRAWCSTAQSISNTTITKISMDTETFDTNNNFDAVTNFRYTAPVTGYYNVHVQATINTNGATDRQIGYIYKNNALWVETAVSFSRSGNPNAVVVDDIVPLTAGDTVDARIFQDSGGARTLALGATDTYITIGFAYAT